MPVDGTGIEMWIMRPSRTAVVMGSGQKPEQFRGAVLGERNIELAARRSGGGAVYIEPTGMVWVDVLIPKTSALWDDDLVATFLRVGEMWRRALEVCGVTTALCGAHAPPEPSARNVEARLACWAGSGWGELLIDATKVVGLSQRRTRWGARVQGMAVLDGSARNVVEFLDVEPATARAVGTAIGEPIVVAVDHAELVNALQDALRSALHDAVRDPVRDDRDTTGGVEASRE